MLFVLVDSEQNIITEEGQLGLLLYKGGTVCDDNFDDDAAEAICKLMNFTSAVEWNSGAYFEIQSNYDIKLDDVECNSTEWESCSYSEIDNCGHSEDVFLSCSHMERGNKLRTKKVSNSLHPKLNRNPKPLSAAEP